MNNIGGPKYLIFIILYQGSLINWFLNEVTLHVKMQIFDNFFKYLYAIRVLLQQ